MYEEEQLKLDREWYSDREEDSVVDDAHNPFAQHDEYYARKEQELAKRQIVLNTIKKILF